MIKWNIINLICESLVGHTEAESFQVTRLPLTQLHTVTITVLVTRGPPKKGSSGCPSVPNSRICIGGLAVSN